MQNKLRFYISQFKFLLPLEGRKESRTAIAQYTNIIGAGDNALRIFPYLKKKKIKNFPYKVMPYLESSGEVTPGYVPYKR